jgi:UDP-glucose 4-epimerase
LRSLLAVNQSRMTNKILVIGPDGFLASHVIRTVRDLSSQHIIVGLGRKSSSRQSLDFYYDRLDVLQMEHPAFDVIYLLASHIPSRAYQTTNSLLIDTNIELVITLVKRYASSRFIFSSSVSVYGTPSEHPLTVSSAFKNPDLYGLSKLAGEVIIRSVTSYGILRFSSIIGNGMGRNTMIPKMIDGARTGAITVWGRGERLQNYIDVRDAATMCVRAAATRDSFIALGVGVRSYSNREVATLLSELTNAPMEFFGEDTSPSFIYDGKDSFATLSFTPSICLRDSLIEILKG